MSNKHPHADLIKAWADDTSIELQFLIDGEWYSCGTNIFLGQNNKYRIKEKPPEPFTLDWSVLDKRWKYAAVDDDGEIYVYTYEPKQAYWGCYSHFNDFLRIDHILTCYTRGTVKPEDSLIKRPDDE